MNDLFKIVSDKLNFVITWVDGNFDLKRSINIPQKTCCFVTDDSNEDVIIFISVTGEKFHLNWKHCSNIKSNCRENFLGKVLMSVPDPETPAKVDVETPKEGKQEVLDKKTFVNPPERSTLEPPTTQVLPNNLLFPTINGTFTITSGPDKPTPVVEKEKDTNLEITQKIIKCVVESVQDVILEVMLNIQEKKKEITKPGYLEKRAITMVGDKVKILVSTANKPQKEETSNKISVLPEKSWPAPITFVRFGDQITMQVPEHCIIRRDVDIELDTTKTIVWEKIVPQDYLPKRDVSYNIKTLNYSAFGPVKNLGDSWLTIQKNGNVVIGACGLPPGNPFTHSVRHYERTYSWIL